MGQQESKSKQDMQKYIDKLMKQYKHLGKISSSPVYGNGNIYTNPYNNDQVFEKSILLNNPDQKWNPKILQHSNIISSSAFLLMNEEAFCSDGNSYFINSSLGKIQRVFYPYYTSSLQNKIKQRQLAFFSEPEIWNFLYQLLTTANYLQSQKTPHTDIKPQTILIDQNQNLLLAPYGTFYDDSTGYQKKQNTNQLVFLAPEQLLAFNQNDPNPNFNLFKCDLYAIGLTLLSCMSLMHGSHFYLYDQLNKDGIKRAFDKIEGNFSDTLISFVTRMLYKNPDKRPTFQKYCSILKPYELPIQHYQTFEIQYEQSKERLTHDEDQIKSQQSQHRFFQSYNQQQYLSKDNSQVQSQFLNYQAQNQTYNQNIAYQSTQEQDSVNFQNTYQKTDLRRVQSQDLNFLNQNDGIQQKSLENSNWRKMTQESQKSKNEYKIIKSNKKQSQIQSLLNQGSQQFSHNWLMINRK